MFCFAGDWTQSFVDAGKCPPTEIVNWPLEVQGLLVGQSEALPFWGVSYIWKKDDGYLCGSVLVHKKSLRQLQTLC